MACAEVGMCLRWEGTGVDEIGILEFLDEYRYKTVIGQDYESASLHIFKPQTGQVLIRIDSRYFRPTEVDKLIGDPSKAKDKLGWQPKYSLADLVKEMMISDIQVFKKELHMYKNGYTLNIPQE